VQIIERVRSEFAPPAVKRPLERPVVRGKFLYAGDQKLFVRGVTYGTFATDEQGRERFEPSTVERDFALMSANGINGVRIYTVPPLFVLDAAACNGLRVMVGLPWEQHVAFLDEAGRTAEIERRVREEVRRVAGHPAVLCYAVGNEIPGPIVRWLGAHRVEGFLERLCAAVRDEDGSALITYVNYPTTEYLQLPFVDFVSFNVYLERRADLAAYLARLQNIAGERPLVMAEVGLDSRRNGEVKQAQILDWQLRTIFAEGCAGAFVFAWTDEWHRGGQAIQDWDFGLVRRDRSPKPALAVVSNAFDQVPFREDEEWPRISVVVCAYNAEPTMRECLEGLRHVDYPDFEVIVVDDGSTDRTAEVAQTYDVRLISTSNRGLSNARNTGLAASNGSIVAYLDSDAYPEPDWLKYLARAFANSTFVGIGGPNLAPPGLGALAECFDNAPGGPTHVLISDREAEHIPGCNMAFRRDCLEAIGGFDPGLRVAGDDVDICWRLQERGWQLGFTAGAVVWHHRRTTLRSYWKQQWGYGRAEALLERKWPDKYNAMGHASWGGRIYARGIAQALGFGRGRIYHGVWGNAPFQTLATPQPGLLASVPLMPEWSLVIAGLIGLSALGIFWAPLRSAVPLLALAVCVSVWQAVAAARRAVFDTRTVRPREAVELRGVVAFLHLVQPLARLKGRLQHGLTFWRVPGSLALGFVPPRTYRIWSETWIDPSARLESIERSMRAQGLPAVRGGEYDRWDLSARGGALGFARLRMAVEEHGSGRQQALFRVWCGATRAAFATVAVPAAAALWAGLDHASIPAGVLGAIALGAALRGLQECASAAQRFDRAINA
jgi:O-antigen biosynthesis protein